MSIIETATAREFSQIISSQNYEFIRQSVALEIRRTQIARFREDSFIEFVPKTREVVSSVLAAALYPDDKQPTLIVARDESETHEVLRARHPASDARLSGEQYTLKGVEQLKFLSLDPVILKIGVTTLPTERQLPEVVNWLLDQNIVPVDAEYRLIRG
ncbi:hypothetical protein ISS86_00180 [Candidatus Microgenomates bacterium]|nr:hypothetical protein [Candidatus Microgenomates bacterium]